MVATLLEVPALSEVEVTVTTAVWSSILPLTVTLRLLRYWLWTGVVIAALGATVSVAKRQLKIAGFCSWSAIATLTLWPPSGRSVASVQETDVPPAVQAGVMSPPSRVTRTEAVSMPAPPLLSA